jgi:CRISPR-associated Csx2 family protein
MGRRVFISFLGTNSYVETYYTVNDKKITEYPVRFIQEALIDYQCKEWTENDKILIFYTKDSCDKNWLDGGQKDYIQGLQSILKSKESVVKLIVEGKLIPEGFSEDDIWEIFNIVYDELEEGDDVYFDVTHAFRSIPLFSVVLFNFAQFTKKINIVEINYGAFEKLGPAYLVKNMPMEERVAPVVSLMNVIRLQQLTQTANEFMNYGKLNTVSQILKTTQNTLETTTKAQRRIKDTLITLQKNITLFEQQISSCQLDALRQASTISIINSDLIKVLNSNVLNQAEKVVFEKIQTKISKFDSQPSNENIERAIEWALEYNMLQQVYTLAREYIIYFIYENNLLRTNDFWDSSDVEKDKNIREFISALLSISDEDIENANFKNYLSKYAKELTIIFSNSWVKDLRLSYKKIADNRNQINHGKKGKSFNQLKDEFINYYNNSIKILKGLC